MQSLISFHDHSAKCFNFESWPVTLTEQLRWCRLAWPFQLSIFNAAGLSRVKGAHHSDTEAVAGRGRKGTEAIYMYM